MCGNAVIYLSFPLVEQSLRSFLVGSSPMYVSFFHKGWWARSVWCFSPVFCVFAAAVCTLFDDGESPIMLCGLSIKGVSRAVASSRSVAAPWRACIPCEYKAWNVAMQAFCGCCLLFIRTGSNQYPVQRGPVCMRLHVGSTAVGRPLSYGNSIPLFVHNVQGKAATCSVRLR